MPKTKTAPVVAEESHDLRIQLSAGTVDIATGIIHGATVAKANVPALGKFVMLDKAGAITRDPKQMAKKIPVFTDAKTLTTLMGAVQDAGGNLKVREDHDDAIGSRAGFIDAFKLSADSHVSADIHLFDAYRNRGVVLETTNKTPKKMGLSIDFVPSYEITEGKALMRIESIEAVDIVDAGAITPDGMFLSAGVDRRARNEKPRSQTQTDTQMTPEEMQAAMNKMMEPFLKGLDECKAALAKLTPTSTTPDAAAMAAAIKPVTDQLATVTASLAAMKRERALLGFKGTSTERQTLASGGATAEEIEKLNVGAKTYLEAVEEHAKAEKCSKSAAHIHVQRANRELYAEHLKVKGVYDPSRDQTRAA